MFGGIFLRFSERKNTRIEIVVSHEQEPVVVMLTGLLS